MATQTVFFFASVTGSWAQFHVVPPTGEQDSI